MIYKCKVCGSKWRTSAMLSDDGMCVFCLDIDLRKVDKNGENKNIRHNR